MMVMVKAMVLDAAWWQLGALVCALVVFGLVVWARGRGPWWLSFVGGIVGAALAALALLVRKAPNGPAEGFGGDGGVDGPRDATEGPQRPRDAFEEMEHEANRYGVEAERSPERLDDADAELEQWRAGAKRDGIR